MKLVKRFLNYINSDTTIPSNISTSSIFGMKFAKVFLNENIPFYQIIVVGVILGRCYLIKI